MRVGLFPGTFDPPHLGHLIMACDFYQILNLDIVYFIPTKKYETDKNIFASPEDRYNMVKLMIADFPFLEVSDFEINSNETNYTYKTLQYFKNKFSINNLKDKKIDNNKLNEVNFFILVGYDWKEKLNEWKNIDYLKENSKIVLYLRYNNENSIHKFLKLKNEKDYISKIFIENNFIVDENYIIIGRPITISSSEIRKNIKEGKPYKQFIREEVSKYIEDKGLYL